MRMPLRACSLWADEQYQNIQRRWLVKMIKKQWKYAGNYVNIRFEKRQRMSCENGISVSVSNLIYVYWRLSCLKNLRRITHMSNTVDKIYHAAIYVRLSKEDGDVAGAAKAESNSISNQKNLIKDFLKNKNDIIVVSERVDDGYSGSNFERPAFQMMMEDIKRGTVDCVIVKDLSRFGREYIDSGKYIERLFPALGVRFIAINDHIDSKEENGRDDIVVPFKNLMNDAYCRDISIKIRSHLEVKRKNGEYIGAFTPYGYKKDENNRNRLVPDLYAAGVVKEIFRMKLHGMSQSAIADRLNGQGILSPMEYKHSLGIRIQDNFKTHEQAEWSSMSVRRILENEVYIGMMLYHFS